MATAAASTVPRDLGGTLSDVRSPTLTIVCAPCQRPARDRLPIRRKKASQGNDVMRTFALKRGAKHGERDDREQRNYPPALLRRMNAAIGAPAESNFPPTAPAIRPIFHLRTGSERRCDGQSTDLLRYNILVQVGLSASAGGVAGRGCRAARAAKAGMNTSGAGGFTSDAPYCMVQPMLTLALIQAFLPTRAIRCARSAIGEGGACVPSRLSRR